MGLRRLVAPGVSGARSTAGKSGGQPALPLLFLQLLTNKWDLAPQLPPVRLRQEQGNHKAATGFGRPTRPPAPRLWPCFPWLRTSLGSSTAACKERPLKDERRPFGRSPSAGCLRREL